ncbi:helix-turn-helix domain-containing protein [Siminovitchia sp. FSL H7-0308]|uniref:helix-turn-helix domain-containing protein n=1 Tax=Siminovitchia sp. FSL H7-0308 TaxID=2921432 RepID=UPI0030ED9788
MGLVIALDISMGKSYKVTYDDQTCLSEGEIIHNKEGFQALLRNVLERAFLSARGRKNRLSADHFPAALKGFMKRKPASSLSLKDIEKEMIKRALSETKNVKEASKRLGIARSTLYRKMKEWEIGM